MVGERQRGHLKLGRARHHGVDARSTIEQGKLAAAAILGRVRPAEDVPWFWSNQYDLKLQIAGLSLGSEGALLAGMGLIAASFPLSMTFTNGSRPGSWLFGTTT